MYNPPLVPDDFELPVVHQTQRLRLRPLTIHDAVKDFDAVANSEERLRSVYGPGGGSNRTGRSASRLIREGEYPLKPGEHRIANLLLQ
jgi:hypothetical protein